MSYIKSFEEFEGAVFSIYSELEKFVNSLTHYKSMRSIIDKTKARTQYKEFFENIEGSVKIVLEALNNELIDIL